MKPIASVSVALLIALMLGSSAEAAIYPVSADRDAGLPAFYPVDGSFCYLNPPPNACDEALAPGPGPAANNPQAAQVAPVAAAVPEPEVFAMMLLGLVLIGYRASRDSGEIFTK